MIMIFGTLVLNDDNSRVLFILLKFSLFDLLREEWLGVGVGWLKGLKIPQNEK